MFLKCYNYCWSSCGDDKNVPCTYVPGIIIVDLLILLLLLQRFRAVVAGWASAPFLCLRGRGSRKKKRKKRGKERRMTRRRSVQQLINNNQPGLLFSFFLLFFSRVFFSKILVLLFSPLSPRLYLDPGSASKPGAPSPLSSQLLITVLLVRTTTCLDFFSRVVFL